MSCIQGRRLARFRDIKQQTNKICSLVLGLLVNNAYKQQHHESFKYIFIFATFCITNGINFLNVTCIKLYLFLNITKLLDVLKICESFSYRRPVKSYRPT